MAKAVGRARGFVLDRVLRHPVVFTDRRSLRYVLYPGENAGAYFASGGNYEVAETRLCERLLAVGDVVIDGGANIGVYSLFFRQLVGGSGLVVAFEPDPVNAERLRSNLALNEFETVVVEDKELWSAPGRMELHRFEPAFGPWHSLGSPELPHPFQKHQTVRPVDSVDVAVTSLDAYCAEAGIERIALLKLDVEGAEPDALAGSSSLLARGAIDAVLFEVSLPQSAALGHSPADSFAVLEEHGYRAFTIRADGGVGDPIDAATSRYGNYIAFRPDSAHAPAP
jgi:FkbM family methyltransferase